jgi:2-polyprenyl-3-methyl-5-hydroxy-6-metoxy-1,4-benzoquinol methylase
MTTDPPSRAGYSATDAGSAGESSQPSYVLGHSDAELDRLTAQARQLEPITRQFFEEAGIGAGMHVLDVGSGAGDVSFLVGDLVGPAGHVVGVDRAADAVKLARDRAAALSLNNVCSFRQGDVTGIRMAERFDAVVGRYVLMFQPDPAALLGALLEHLHPGGLVIFHEPEWIRASSFPTLPNWQRCCELVVQTMTAGGADMQMGMKLSALFQNVGLAAPSLRMRTIVGAGANCADAVHLTADILMTLLPQAERAGLVAAGEIDPDTYVESLIAMVRESGSVVIGRSEVGAWSRLSNRGVRRHSATSAHAR